ncbi:MAG: elongation factor Ts [Candidatus Dojkabacteria bacterium]|nr:MAG: elongation factor Ts [Candidatus Dojkabacteria bacterium]
MTNAQMIVELRKETGASFGLVKEAVEAHPEDMAKAREFLMEKLRNTVSSRGEKETKNGIIEVYSHAPMKNVACMVEILCETDFVAKNEELHKFAREIALQIVAMNPLYVDRESIPQEELDKLTAQWAAEVAAEGKPQQIVDKIVEGKLNKYLQEICLLEQLSFKNDTMKMRDLLKEVTGKLGENIKISKFSRWQI